MRKRITDDEAFGCVGNRRIFTERIKALFSVGIDAVVVTLKDCAATVQKQLIEVGCDQAKAPSGIGEHLPLFKHWA